MVCYCLDLRPNSKLGEFLSHKIVSLIAASVQLALWIFILLGLSFAPSSVKNKLSSAELAIGILVLFIGIAFNILLFIGLIKNKMRYVLAHQLYTMVYISLLVLGFFVTLFTHPSNLGFAGAISCIFVMLFNLLILFILRNYYLSYTLKQKILQQGNPNYA